LARRAIIAGNWKMNKTPDQAQALVSELIPLVHNAPCDVVVGPPAVSLERVGRAVADSAIALAAQNVHWEPKGAFTGELSIEMLRAVGVAYVIIGHSERRQYFGETDPTVNRRAKAIVEGSLIPIVCVGETLDQRRSGRTHEVVETQVRGCLEGLSGTQVGGLVMAYEPVWAIGTGQVATPDQAQEVHALIRGVIGELYDRAVAEAIRIQYGGSMKPDNAAALLGQPDIDGGLIGGASLQAADFAAICHAVG